MAEQMLPTLLRFKDPNPCNRRHRSREKPGIDTNEPIQPFLQRASKISDGKGGCSAPRTAHETHHGSTDVDDDLALTVPGLDQGVRPRELSKREPCTDDRVQLPCLDQISQGRQTCVAGLY